MRLIVDSGSTKAIWVLLSDTEVVERFITIGINPYQQTEIEITTQLKEVLEVYANAIQTVHFYGSGVTKASSDKIKRGFEQTTRKVESIDIQSDILAAAHALCQNKAGIACILGTGSNSCLYDGNKIIDHIGGHGFILGDDGSGAILGRQLMSDYLHKQMPNDIYKKLETCFSLSTDSILESVYRKPFPNRFLASFAPFLLEYASNDYIQSLILAQFRIFFKKKVLCYDNFRKYPIHFVGSVAYYFEAFLRSVGEEFGVDIICILKDPMDGLVEYYLTYSELGQEKPKIC